MGYALFFLGIAWIIKLKNKRNPIYRFYVWGLLAKLTGGIIFASVYKFYYTYGDTFAYHGNGINITNLLYQDPLLGIKFLFDFNEGLDPYLYDNIVPANRITVGIDTRTVCKISGLTNIFCWDNFFANTMWFSFISFLGLWKLVLVLQNEFRSVKFITPIVVSVLFLPSVVFWGSGLMKDSIAIGALGYFMYSFSSIVKGKLPKITNLLIGTFSGLILIFIKPYIIITFLPAFLFWAVLNLKNKIKNRLLRVLSLPIILLIGAIITVFSVSSISEFSPRYKMDNVVNSARVYQENHYSAEGGSTSLGTGSGYTLGSFDNSVLGIALVAPAAVNVTLFRPYIFEISSPIMVFAALESSFFLILSLIILFKGGIRLNLKIIKSNSFLSLALTFTLLFAFAVGFSSYNFGALVRYKIPCIPFFAFTLFFLRIKLNEERLKSKLTRNNRRIKR